MKTKLEEIAEKARQMPKFKFTSLAHHITPKAIWESLSHIDVETAPGVDGISLKEAKETFPIWENKMIQAIHSRGYKPPAVRRVWIPKPGKQEKRPIGIPTVTDRALQRTTSEVLTSIYEQDFLDCSFGGRPERSAHQAIATLNRIIGGKKVNWVYEADLKNFFGSLNQEWLIKFVEHRIGDPRIINLIKRWLKAGVLENGEINISERGTPQGGSISVLLSNIYLHYVLDLWFEKIVKPRMHGETYLIRYIDDFIICFQYENDAKRFQEVLAKRLAKFSLALEPSKTRLVEFGKFAKQNVLGRGEKLETIYFLGFTYFCANNRKGNFRLGCKTEKSRFKRSVGKMKELLHKTMHDPIKEQIVRINRFLKGHYAYYGLGGNLQALSKLCRITGRWWKRTLSQRSQKSRLTWDKFLKIKERYPMARPKLILPYSQMEARAIL